MQIEKMDQFLNPDKENSVGPKENTKKTAIDNFSLKSENDSDNTEQIEFNNQKIKQFLFPQFEGIIIQLKNCDYVINNRDSTKLFDLAKKCDFLIDSFLKLHEKENLLIKQIGVLTILKRFSHTLANVRNDKTLETEDTLKIVCDKLVDTLPRLKEDINNL